MTRHNHPQLRCAFRAATFCCAFALCAVGVWAGVRRGVERAHIDPTWLVLNLPEQVRFFQQEMHNAHGPERIVLVGDSTLMSDPRMSDPASQTLSGRVARALHRRGARGGAATVQMLCSPGLGPSGIYFLSDMIIDAHPDRLVFGINLRGFNRGSLHDFGYGEVAGWVGAKRLFEAARLPLFAVGVTFDRLLLYNAIVAAGGAELWLHVRQLQSRTARAYTPAGKWIDELFGSTGQADMQFSLGIARMTRTQLADGKRQSRQQAEHTFGPVLGGLSTDEPSLHILVGALRRFRQAGIPTLVYVQPTNFEHLHVLGLNTAGFERSVAVIQETVQREGAQFADFHALFPDGGFRDAGDHYTFDGKPNGTAWLGDRIAYAISQGWLTGKLPPEADHALQ